MLSVRNSYHTLVVGRRKALTQRAQRKLDTEGTEIKWGTRLLSVFSVPSRSSVASVLDALWLSPPTGGSIQRALNVSSP